MPYFDERANQQQREALLKFITGEAKGEGPFEIIITTLSNVLERQYVSIEFSGQGRECSAKMGDTASVAFEPIKNPVTGEPEEIQLVKPTGFSSTSSDLGTSAVCRYTGGFQHYVSGKYAEFAPYEYRGP